MLLRLRTCDFFAGNLASNSKVGNSNCSTIKALSRLALSSRTVSESITAYPFLNSFLGKPISRYYEIASGKVTEPV